MDKRQTQLKILFLAFFGWSFLFLGSSSAHASSMIIGGATGTPRDVIFSGLVKASSSMGILTAADPTYNLKINQSLYFPSGTLIQNGNMTVDYINDLGNPVAFLDLSSSETSLSAAGNLTTAGNIFASGLGNNYFLGNVGIGLTNPFQSLTIFDPGLFGYSEKRGFLSVDNILFSSLHGGMHFGRVGVTENQWSVTGIPTDWRQNFTAPEGNWHSVAMSSDGRFQTAGNSIGYIYYSADSGAHWHQSNLGGYYWVDIAMSSDGKIQTAVSNNGIYCSFDYGVNWKQVNAPNSLPWASVAMSSDGRIQVAAVTNGYIYISTDYGINWNESTSSGTQVWISVAMSSDGKIQAAAVDDGNIFYSMDYGSVWEESSSGSQRWTSIAMSSDGKIQVAADKDKNIYYSLDYGANWSPSSAHHGANGVAISSDGRVQAAVTNDVISYSTNYGVDWTDISYIGEFRKIAISSDGKIQTVAPQGTDYLSTSYGGSYNLGRVGIGTTNPQYALDIEGDVNFGGDIFFNGFNLGVWNVSDNHIYYSAGNVGIGVTNPSYAIDVNTVHGDAYNRFQAGSATQNVGTVLGRNGLNQWYMYSPANTTDFRISGLAVADPLTIKDTTGNVGIGTTNPIEKLDVFGKVAINGNPLIYLPNQTNFLGTIYLGNGSGGANLTWSPTYDYYGKYNTLIGIGSGQLMATGTMNTALGYNTLSSNVGGPSNTAIGANVLAVNQTGGMNTAVGAGSLEANISGSSNTAIGGDALNNNISGNYNIALGRGSAFYNQTGEYNNILGSQAFRYNVSGSRNIALGYRALYYSTSSSDNIAIGQQAGQYFSGVGDYNIFIGQNAGTGGKANVTNSIAIGQSANPTADYQVTLGGDSILSTILKGNVGIGMTNPGDKLNVLGVISANYIDYVNYPKIRGIIQHVGNPNGLSITSQGANASTGGSGDIRFLTSDSNSANGSTDAPVSEKMRIKYNGNVGIGTTNPSSPLTVNAASEGNLFNFKSNNVSYFSMTGYNLLYGRDSGGSVSMNNPIIFGNNTMSSLNNTPFFLINPSSDNSGNLFEVRSGVTPKFLVSAAGNIGIGATNPTAATLVIATSSGNYSFDAGAFRIGNLGTPVLGTDGATKSYVDSSISNNIFSISRRSVSDADTSIASTTDRLVVYTSISAPRTVTIPTDVCTTGRILTIGDESGSVSLTNTITVTPTSGSISGTSTLVINEPYNNVSIYCKGSGNSWFIY